MLSFFPSSLQMLSLPSRVFECVAFFHSHNPYRRKLDPRVVKCVSLVIPQIKRGLSVIILQVVSHSLFEPVIESLPFPTQDVIKSLPFSIQDVQVQVQEVMKHTLVLKQVQLSRPEVSILENRIEDVTDDMPIALRKGK
ncbi:hypothetical protein CR513_47710, partial [Mucuna pruriens]